MQTIMVLDNCTRSKDKGSKEPGERRTRSSSFQCNTHVLSILCVPDTVLDTEGIDKKDTVPDQKLPLASGTFQGPQPLDKQNKTFPPLNYGTPLHGACHIIVLVMRS